MTKNKTSPKSFYYQQTHAGVNYDVNKFWCPGMELEKSDEILLISVKEFYKEYGYTPSRKDISADDVRKLKARFRTWKNVLIAAGLPAMNDAETQRCRQKAKACNKEA